MVGKGHSSKNKENASTEGEADPDAFVFSTDGLIGDVQRKVMAVFEVFDQQGQKMVDVREVGTMCRALELYPNEADVHEIIGCVEETTAKGMNYEMRPAGPAGHMTKVIFEGKYKPVSHDDIMQAFRAVDKDKKGVLEPPKFKEMLMKEGENFTAEEVDEMLNFAVNKGDNLVHWEEYVEKLYRSLHL